MSIGAVLFLALFALISYHSEFRRTDAGTFGGLYSRRTTPPAPVPPPHYEVIKEAPVAESVSADPLSLDTARREQMLGVTPAQTASPTLSEQTTVAVGAPVRDFQPLSQDDPAHPRRASRFQITGGADGVSVAVK